MKIRIKIILFLIAPLFWLSSGCAGGAITEKTINQLRQVELPDLEVTLLLPDRWDLSFQEKRFYQLIGAGFDLNGELITFEFRSLATRIKDPAGKNLFATGWYQSPLDNFPGWKFISRSKVATDPEGAYEFEGTFKRKDVTYRRFGRLKFRKNRVYAFYYTTLESSSGESVRQYINAIDSQHSYQ